MENQTKKAEDMNLEDVIKRLMSNKDEKFFVNTSVKVLSVDKNVKEGSTWRLGRINAGNIEYSGEVKLNIRINLWDKFCILVNDLEKDDIIVIKKGFAKNYSYDDKIYPQINCSEKYSSDVEINYNKERILVDGSNVAWTSKRDGKPNIDNIYLIQLELEKQGYVPIIIVDAALRHQIHENQKEKLEKWLNDEKVIQSPAQVRADDSLLKLADERNLKIVSNDTLKDYNELYPWLEDKSRRVPYNIVGLDVVLYFR
ncbi:MAG: hypothetical protein A7316_09460 [Candidatus Altiarchaeales archaeon WOR_SM1_86-2]|nr:MAG: hypothetical protein A7316_09460 [Candidatus Altiarchaeales archaeon WOR_SM1_86-2]